MQPSLSQVCIRVHLCRRTHAHCGSAHANFDAKLGAALQSADVIVANLGVWYGQEKERSYRSDVRYMLRELQRAAARSGGAKLTLFRESTPQHFHTASCMPLWA